MEKFDLLFSEMETSILGKTCSQCELCKRNFTNYVNPGNSKALYDLNNKPRQRKFKNGIITSKGTFIARHKWKDIFPSRRSLFTYRSNIGVNPNAMQKRFISNIFASNTEELDKANRKAQRKKFGCDDETRRNEDRGGLCMYKDDYGCDLKWADDDEACKPCHKPIYMKAAPLKRLRRRYCDEDVPHCIAEVVTCDRLDDNLKLTAKCLPRLELNTCCKPEPHLPSICPKIEPPTKTYDDSEMPYPHDCPPSRCDCFVRLDDIYGIHYKKLKKFKPVQEQCEYCHDKILQPKILPRIKRLVPRYVDVDPPKPPECFPEPCIRPVDVVVRKRLPKLVPHECHPCEDCHKRACKGVKLKQLKKRYDDTKMGYRHKCPVPFKCPPRLDDNYKMKKKVLQKLRYGTCKPVEPRPLFLPKIRRLRKAYDDSKLKELDCIPPPEDPCIPPPPRLDDNLVEKTKKSLPKLPLVDDCLQCTTGIMMPTFCPKLASLKRRFDENTMLYPHEDCPVDDRQKRMDDGLKLKVHQLPKYYASQKCQSCTYIPTLNPPIGRPRRRPAKFEDKCMICEPTCNIDPPRLDDVCCYRPKVKRLPPFLPKKYDPVPDEPEKVNFCL